MSRSEVGARGGFHILEACLPLILCMERMRVVWVDVAYRVLGVSEIC